MICTKISRENSLKTYYLPFKTFMNGRKFQFFMLFSSAFYRINVGFFGCFCYSFPVSLFFLIIPSATTPANMLATKEAATSKRVTSRPWRAGTPPSSMPA